MRRYRQRRSLPEEPITVVIDKLSHEGRGIGKHQGKVTFVEQALPGETVSARLTFSKSSFDEAVAVEVADASPDRVSPPCEFFSVCGGCSLQHYAPAAQITFKQGVLQELLEQSLEHDSFTVLEPLTGPTLAYRRKARLAVRYVAKKEAVLVGFREKHSNFITQMDSCQVLDPQVSALIPDLAALIKGMKACRAIPQIEVACGDSIDDNLRLALVFRHLEPLQEQDMDALMQFAGSKGFALYLQPKGMDTIHKVWPEAGEERQYYELPEHGLQMAFHPADFTQVNADINRAMIMRALELLDLNSDDEVLDLFCGLGNFTLPIATRCGHVTGIEAVQEMVDRGYENASRNKIANADFACADLFKPVEGDWVKGSYSKVFLDPPRSGAKEIIPVVAGLKPERIVYVSCNPATLARDARMLEELGYRLECAGVMDMFPHTTHVESIALFLPKGAR